MVTTHITEARFGEWRRIPGQDDETEDGFQENLKLGHDIRFLLVVVGGGAIRIGEEIARQHLRYLETVAINCDPSVQTRGEFDRRVYLGSEDGVDTDTQGSPVVGAQLARAALSALERIFEGATFVTVISSLGGGTGTGALPVVLEAAARNCEVLSVFVIRPFECEGERRATADRSVARLNSLPAWVEKEQRGVASLQILDNEALGRNQPDLAFNRMNRHWAGIVSAHIEKAFLIPAEAAVEAGRIAQMGEAEVIGSAPAFSHILPEAPATANAPGPLPPSMAPNAAPGAPPEVELTFEIVLPPTGPAPP